MTNNYVCYENYPLFDEKKGCSQFEGMEDIMPLNEFLKQSVKAGVDIFKAGGEFDQLIDLYLKMDWHIVGSNEWYNFKMKTHSIKGRFRYWILVSRD